MMLKMDLRADCTGYGLQDLMLLFIFNSAFIKMGIGFPGGQEAQDGRGKKDETNFLPLPEIRMPGLVYFAPFQV